MSEVSVYIKPNIQLSSEDDDLWLGISKLFSLFGLALAGSTSNRLSSNIKVVLVTTVLFAGSLLMIFGPCFFYLLLGRLIINIGAGYNLTITSVYITEISPIFYRSLLTSFLEVFRIFMNGGTLLAYVSHYFLSRMRTKFARSYLFYFGGIPFGLVAFGVLAMPGSPQWLVKHGRVEEARDILAQISDSEEEVACQLDEQTSIVNHREQLIFLISVDLVKTMFTLVCTISIDQMAQGRLMLISIGGMILSLASLGISLAIIHHHEEVEWADAICVFSLLCYTASFSIGMGPVALVYSSVIFPMRLRAQGGAIGVAVGQVISGTMSMSFMIALSRAVGEIPTLGQTSI